MPRSCGPFTSLGRQTTGMPAKSNLVGLGLLSATHSHHSPPTYTASFVPNGPLSLLSGRGDRLQSRVCLLRPGANSFDRRPCRRLAGWRRHLTGRPGVGNVGRLRSPTSVLVVLDRSPRTITMTRSRESAGSAKASPPPRGTLSALDAAQARSREEDVRPMQQVLPGLPVQELRSAIQPFAHHQPPPESRRSREAADVLSPHGSLGAQNIQGSTASSSRAAGAVQAPKPVPHSRRASAEAVPGGSPGKATAASAEVQDLFPFYLDDKLLEMMKPSGPNCSDPMKPVLD
ncbi:hypothetical protein AK812_SmicGene8574 [Symbiodinium microadriaticum]|uniref:Uncharacterized protein n=1 Tax=Symbiodinium microadriaticum TaxID=2951 RepID=A0A1Q9EKI0_SYMMI|nr:hypothetical protein AK812_SmicGene8574 [Symbiodinium microadriaticum]